MDLTDLNSINVFSNYIKCEYGFLTALSMFYRILNFLFDIIVLVLNAGCSIKGVAYAESAHGDMELNYYGNRNMLASFSPLIGHNGRVGNTRFL